MKTEIREEVQKLVRGYFAENGHRYISNFVKLTEDDKMHLINTGTSIICTRDKVSYPGGSFVKSMVNNDLKGAFATADDINRDAIYFYLMMMHNMSY